MSLGGPLPNIFEWFAYQNLLEDDGILCIAAAGNFGNRTLIQSFILPFADSHLTS